MTKISTIVVAIAAAASVLSAGSAAFARGKESYTEDYQFKKPMHGYSGQAGGYYCDYQRLPNRQCVVNANGTETCKIVGWTLREMCQ